MKLTLLLFSFLFSLNILFSQGHFTFPEKNANWVKFDKDAPKDPELLIEQYGRSLGLDEGQELLLTKTMRDALGITHFHYQQLHNGIAVEGGEFLFHVNTQRNYSKHYTKELKGLDGEIDKILNAIEDELTSFNN